jgi:hypothetical protein
MRKWANAMEKLLTLLLEHPGLASEVAVPCALWGFIEREDDASFTSEASSTAPRIASTLERCALSRDFLNRSRP